jgi:DnaJ-class molecular chaperone
LTDHASSDRRQAGARSGPNLTGSDPNYYQLLGVAFDATSDEIRRAYRTAMKEKHPDRQQGPDREAGRARAEDQARLLNRAYATLSKPESRRQYDQTIRAQAMQDELMSRYVGGFVEQWQTREAQQFMHTPSEAERREQARDSRQAMITLLTAFVVMALLIIVLVVLYGLGEALVNAIF